jgi:hypothetical protein
LIWSGQRDYFGDEITAAMTENRTLPQFNTLPSASNDNEAMICTIFIEDDRYSVPTISILPVADIARALAFAERKLRSSAHYLQIEARQQDELLFVLSRDDIR